MSLNLLNGWDGPVVNYATVSAISNMGLKSLIIKYSSTCVKGIDFSFNNGEKIKLVNHSRDQNRVFVYVSFSFLRLWRTNK